MDYTSLIGPKATSGSIKQFVNYSQIDPAQLLEDAQALLNSMLRTREMIAAAVLSLAVGDSTEPLPTRFLDPIGAFIVDQRNIAYRHVLETTLMASRVYDSSGVLLQGLPSCWSVFDEAIQFDAKFDTLSTMTMLYYKAPTPLGDGSAGTATTNFLTSRYPNVLRQACRVEAHAFMKNWDAHQAELTKLEAMVARVNQEADLAQRGADIDTENRRR
jgi:hypothetical protein